MAEAESRWRLNGVRVVHVNELDINTPQTPGMNRAAACRSAGAKLWAGRPIAKARPARTITARSRA
jgi:hypothetical protein